MNKEDKEVINIINSEDFRLEILPEKYQKELILSQKNFIDNNINPYVNKIDNETLEIIKMKDIYNKNVGSYFNIKTNNKQKTL